LNFFSIDLRPFTSLRKKNRTILPLKSSSSDEGDACMLRAGIEKLNAGEPKNSIYIL